MKSFHIQFAIAQLLVQMGVMILQDSSSTLCYLNHFDVSCGITLMLNLTRDH